MVLQSCRRFPPRTQITNLLAELFLFRPELLNFRLFAPLLLVNGKQFINFRRILTAASRKATLYQVRLFANESNVEHGRQL